MKLNHLALAVRDQQRAIEFYARYFGFDPSTARKYPDGVIIIHDADGFALALGTDEASGRSPGFPHFGFEMESPEVGCVPGYVTVNRHRRAIHGWPSPMRRPVGSLDDDFSLHVAPP